eukprot:CAMPEP_0206452890 /NCGR_PEP_ID=MMETSP0324_2-20121206/20212_1 /ASSEMBLY_ACC=CAM_ASM_000836 /TAXON_ID=2866 /ORGANISM="Crypthecodinium cohnii, Strain Seligo" /LENGTH=264 /DNA_ID=CAMNT_0053923061 /DNA_START=49 /DNA_END=843 /DNA_ORIENTATION=+
MTDSRIFSIATVGGSSFEVTVPLTGRVEDLYNECGKHDLIKNPFFTLATEDHSILDCLSAPLPEATSLTLILESFENVACESARKILESAPVAGESACPSDFSEKAQLGLCRDLGKFPTKDFKNDPRMDECASYHDFDLGEYRVVQATLVDGLGKYRSLVGVINLGDGDCNTGMWGPLYLRPDFREVGGLKSSGDTESQIALTDSSWYEAPANYPKSGGAILLGGGENASSTLERHLALALTGAFWDLVSPGEEDWPDAEANED